ncbi:MAG: chloride channel protein [Anaerolineaceae bacterium]|nr:chloride channel protein [Anaerolineaceae bacterium]
MQNANQNIFKDLFHRLGKIITIRQQTTDILFIGSALIVGIGAGLGAVIFRYLIKGFEWVGYEWFPRITSGWGNAYVVIIPAIGGLIVGPLIYFFAREAKGHGVPEVMEAVALKGGRIRPIVAVIKSLASSISIGSGGSVGREGPIVQIGSAIGSTLGQKLNLSDDRIQNLVACGAAGGIAATFNAPIAGVIFALEVILGRFSVRHFSSVVVSAVAASVIGRVVFGNIPAFAIPFEYGINNLWEFAFYPFLGIAAALVGVVFVRALYWTEDIFEKWTLVPEWIKPMIGGLSLGAIALLYPHFTGVSWKGIPQIYNVGYDVIESALANQFTLGIVLTLLILKLIATSLTLGSGGIFAPGLFMGAMLGAAFELIMNAIFPGIAAPPGAYALVGMAAVFAATAHAPITAVLILFELTGDYRIILPLMLTVVISTLTAQWLLKGESIYTLKLTRRGVHLQRGRDVDVMHGVTVSEVMEREINTIDKDSSLKELSDFLTHTLNHGIIVTDTLGKFWGIVTISDLRRAISDHLPNLETTIEKIAIPKSKLLTVYPDESIGDALNRMSRRGVGHLPVVSREDPDELIGLIRRQEIINAYNIGLTRRAAIQNRTKRMQLQNLDGTEFVEIRLSEDTIAIGKTVRELAEKLPQDCILISIRRNNKVLIPHGETTFQAGDQITAFISCKDAKAFHQCFGDTRENMEIPEKM